MWSLRQIEEYYKAQKGSSKPALQCFKSQGHVPSLELLQTVVDSMPPRLLQTAEVHKVHWWMGVNGSTVVTGLHTDLTHNFFFATHGEGGKKFIMFAPWDGDNLHVWPKVWTYSEMLFDFYAFKPAFDLFLPIYCCFLSLLCILTSTNTNRVSKK